MRLQLPLLTLFLSALATAQSPNPSGSNSFNVPPQGYLLHAGESTTFTWSNLAGSTVTLNLRSGANGNLDDGQILASNLANSGSFTWAVPNDIVQGNDYTLEIIDEQDSNTINFTPQFNILSNVLASSSPAPSSTAAPTTSAPAPTSSSAAPSTTAAPPSSSSASQLSTASVMSTLSTAASGSASSASAASTSASGSSAASSTSAAPASTSSSAAVGSVRIGSGAGLLAAVAVGAVGLL